MKLFNELRIRRPKVTTTRRPILTRRLYNSGFETMNHVKREPDTRTIEQLLANIEYFAQENPEVAMFQQDLKAMQPKYLGLVSDICELANQSIKTLPTDIDIKKPAPNGKSLFQFLMEKLPQASKENPASLELSQAIIDNTDSIAAKYTLRRLSGMYDCKEAAERMRATVPLVDFIAEGTLKGGYLMDYSKEEKFAETLINGFLSPQADIEKLQILPQVLTLADDSKALCNIYPVSFVRSNTPMSTITENMKTFTKINQQMDMSGKTVNLTEFLEKNTNLN